jgi:hypothetical protein
VSLRSELGRGTVFRLVIGHVDDGTGKDTPHSFD